MNRIKMRKGKLALGLCIGCLFGVFSCEKDEAVVEKKKVDYPAAYVVNADNTISVINLLTQSVDTTFLISSEGNSFAHHIYKNPDNTHLAVALPSVDLSNGHDKLHDIDSFGGVVVLKASDGTFVSDIITAEANHNAIFSPDGNEIWTGLMSHDSPIVKVYDSYGLINVAAIPVGTDASEVTFSSDGKIAFVAAQESSFVYAIDVKMKEVVKQIKVDFFPTNVWPGTDRVFVENKNRHSINIINTKTLKAEEAIDLDFEPGFTLFHEKSKTLWICDAKNNQVRLFSKSGSAWNEVEKIKTDIDAHAIAISDKYGIALVVNQRSNTVSVIDLVTRKKLKEIVVGLKPNGIVLIE
ncbi:MAG: YVTN family beta-propeller protein [Spirosomataceae bacterium]|jgi:YVTN family beta-propeller protein